MQKPLSKMTQEEKSHLMKHLLYLAELEGDFPGYLGNKNSFFVAKPAPRRRKTAKRAKVAV